MSNGFDYSLSGRSRPQPSHFRSREAIQSNLLELGLLSEREQKKKKTKKAVGFTSVPAQTYSTTLPQTTETRLGAQAAHVFPRILPSQLAQWSYDQLIQHH